MCKLSDVLTYIIDTYSSEKYPISPLRIINILYLTDWKAAISLIKPISGIDWRIIDSEPRVDASTLREIIESVERSGRKFGFGILGKLQRYSTDAPSKSERDALNFVLDYARHQSDEELSRMVKSVYPTIIHDDSDSIDLRNLAKKYEYVVQTLLT